MNREEFVTICNSLGAPNRGWQSAAVEKARALGFSLSQPTLSQAYRNENQKITTRTAQIMRALAAAIASGEITPGAVKDKSNVTVTSEGVAVYKDPDDERSDDEIMEEIADRFTTFEECVEQVVCKNRTGALVSGPAGCGKSHCIGKYEPDANGEFVPITGEISAIGLYKQMYKVRYGGVLVFDDCDGVFDDDTKLNLLKGALDCKTPGTPKWVSWMKESRALVDEDGEKIERTFDFQGRILFMTNVDFEREIERGTRLAPHLKALVDRTGYMSLGLHSKRRRMLWVKHVCTTSPLLENNGVSDPGAQAAIMDFIVDNQDQWRTLNLRLATKLCQYMVNQPDKWEKHARAFEMKARR